MHVYNQTGVADSFVVSRRRIGVDPSWSDFLCWGLPTDAFGGTCIAAGQMDTNIYLGQEPLQTVLADGEYGTLYIHIMPDPAIAGCGTYRYYLGTMSDPFKILLM